MKIKRERKGIFSCMRIIEQTKWFSSVMINSRKVGFKQLFIVFGILLFSNIAYGVKVEIECGLVLTKSQVLFNYHKGDLISKMPNETIYKLGSGAPGEGGTVYRISTSEGSYIRKHYVKEKNLERDRATMLELSKKSVEKVGFLIPKIIKSKNNNLEIQDIKGKTIQQILDDNTISDNLKFKIMEAYEKSMLRLAEYISKRYKVDTKYILLNDNKFQVALIREKKIYYPVVFFEGEDNFNINTHIENVLVHYITGELYLIDPW